VFSLEDSSEIEAVPDASEEGRFLADGFITESMNSFE
jgi:hypothetical protein